MRIAAVIDAWDPILGGGQVHCRELYSRLVREHGCQVDLFVRSLRGADGKPWDRDESSMEGRFRILRCGRAKPFFHLPERLASITSIARRIAREHRAKPYDLVHAHAFLGLAAGKLASLRLGLPVVATVHGANLLDRGVPGLSWMAEKILLTRVKYDAQITVGSSFLRHRNANRPIVIHNGVDLARFTPGTGLERRAGILFVGRMEWTKGIDVLLQALALLKARGRDVSAKLVGYGYDEGHYRDMARELGLEGDVEFAGRLEGDALVRAYREAAVFALPSRTEGFGLTALEAMACGTPVVATRCGGPEDFLRNEENGFLVEPGNPGALAEAIGRALSQQATDGGSFYARSIATAKEFTWDRCAKEHYRLFLENAPHTRAR